MEYKINLNTGEFLCCYCNEKFPMSYTVLAKLFDNYNHSGRKSFPGIAWANFYRHLKKCKALLKSKQGG